MASSSSSCTVRIESGPVEESSSTVRIESGPIEGDVLWLQRHHISEHVWNTGEIRRLHVRRALPTYMGQHVIPDAIVDLLNEAGFYWVCKMSYMKIDGSLIQAFVERWRPETHTFHMRCGECSITLQDIAVLLGLPVDGKPVIGGTNLEWADLAEAYLGVRPSGQDLKGSVVKLSWLAQQFADVTPFLGSPELLQRFTRAWILRFIGGVLFVDKNSARVSLRYLQFLVDLKEAKNYSWGSAVLGFLYRELCNATNLDTGSIGGMTVLIQLWAWERFTCLAPRVIPEPLQHTPLGHRWHPGYNNITSNDDVVTVRRKLDILKTNEFVWEPYTPDIIARLPQICLDGRAVWRSVVPLICFQIAEWHQPDRVLRQFGLRQFIPLEPSQQQNLHQLTLRGKDPTNWMTLLGPVVSIWQNRLQYVIDGIPQEGPLSYNDEYMVWYRKKTKMYIDPKNAQTAAMGEITETLFYMASDEGWGTWDKDDLLALARKMSILTCECERVTEVATTAAPRAQRFPVEEVNIFPNSVETQGLTRNRPAVDAEPYILPPMPERKS